MLSQITVAVSSNHPGLLYSPCQSRDLAVSTAQRATGQLPKAQSSAFLSACSISIVSALRQQNFCTLK